MLKRLILSAAVLALAVSPANAQQRAAARRPTAGAARATVAAKPVSPTVHYDSANYGWIAGNYPEALRHAEALLNAPGNEAYLDSIALLTGELYVTTDVAPDGNGLRWSPDSRTMGFTTGTGAERRLHLVDVSGAAPKEIASFAGAGLVLSPTRNEAAYFAVEETDALKAARARLDSLQRAGAGAGGGGGGFGGPAGQINAEIARQEAAASRVRVRDLGTGQERDVPTPGLAGLSALRYGRDGNLYVSSSVAGGDPNTTNIYALGGGTPKAVSDGAGTKNFIGASATHVVYATAGTAANWLNIYARNMASGATTTFAGRNPAVSGDGLLLAFVGAIGTDTTLNVITLATGAAAIVKQGPAALATPTFSPDGKLVAYSCMPREDWEVYVVGVDGTNENRVTRDPQDDVVPQFIGNTRLLVMKGEPRHRRSYIYDIATHAQLRLFHNNTVRTVSPEYEWLVSPDVSKVLTIADRDGNTISPERGVYLTDFTTKVSKAQLLARVHAQQVYEKDLRARGVQMFAGIATRVKPIVADISSARIYAYSKALFEMDSRAITKPGNLKAIDYFVTVLKAWGYEPEVQWFEPRPGVRTANVVATIKGTKYPDKIHVVSAHFDSVERAPGSDDDGTGTTGLLEAARVLLGHPQPATIKIAFLTGEESGSLGAREFVRLAQSRNEQIVGVLNNDMGGWVEDGRLDDTIRYASDYLRDVEHAAAIEFTKLITYDARYYRGTDAGTFYNAYGPIAAGIGGYPILASPHYHETHDNIETINPEIIAEIARTSVASLMLMAQQPELPKPAT